MGRKINHHVQWFYRNWYEPKDGYHLPPGGTGFGYELDESTIRFLTETVQTAERSIEFGEQGFRALKSWLPCNGHDCTDGLHGNVVLVKTVGVVSDELFVGIDAVRQPERQSLRS